MKDIKSKILRFLEKAAQSITAGDLLKRLKVKDKKAFFLALDELKSEGSIVVNKKKRIRLAQKRTNTVEATVVSLSRGFAFARPDEGTDDFYIRSENLKNAFIGDRVALCGVRQSAKGPSAVVDSILEKGSREITGTLVQNEENLELIPDISVRYRIHVKKKSALTAHDGDKVQVSVYRKNSSPEYEAEVIKVYGRAGSAKICADAILDQNNIQSEFSKEALIEADETASHSITESDLKGRLDLRKTSICTIDGADAKDLDDAISVSKTKNGYRLGVHIADVSHYIPENGRLDLEARSRGTSVYFADRVVPMLPKSLSNGVCSLNAGEDKLTFSAIIDLDQTGNILSYCFRKSVIKSKVRGVYSEVNQLFDGTADKALHEKYFHVIRSLHAARELASILREQFVRAGTVDLESSEPEFTLNSEGVCVDVHPRKSGEAEQMIEYLMITANRAAAMFAKSRGIPFVYRVHEQPNPERVKSLIQLVDALGLDSKPLKHQSGEVFPADFSQILKQAEGTSSKEVVSHQVLRTMAKARYDVKPLGHFGLALSDYCHFTSPIRRYPDTAIHRILSAALALKKKNKPELEEHFAAFAADAAKLSSDAEVRAMNAERSAEDCYMAEYMNQHIGEIYSGIISGVTQRGVFVQLANSVEGFVPIDSFKNCDYQFDGIITQVDRKTGNRMTIGHKLKIQVVSADVPSGRIDFEYVDETDSLQ